MGLGKWDRRFLQMALVVAGWSKDPSTGVGAVIADTKNRVVSVGFNGRPRGLPDTASVLEDREAKLRAVIHAEVNAVLFAQRPVAGCTVYVWPMPPCEQCADVLIQMEVGRVVALRPEGEREARWRASITAALEKFARAGIPVDLYTAEELARSPLAVSKATRRGYRRKAPQEAPRGPLGDALGPDPSLGAGAAGGVPLGDPGGSCCGADCTGLCAHAAAALG